MISNAEDHYRTAIQLLSDIKTTFHNDETATLIHVTLLSNLSMCLLKRYNDTQSEHILLLDCIQHADTAIQILNRSTLTDTLTLRSKVLYRKAKAQFLLATQQHHHQQQQQQQQQKKPNDTSLLVQAKKELQMLLSFDSKNKPALDLMQQINLYTMHREHAKLDGIDIHSSSSSSTLYNVMAVIQQGEQTHDQIVQAWKYIHASVMDDILDSTHEFMLHNGKGIQLLMDAAFSDINHHPFDECQCLAMQSLSCAVVHPPFAQALQRMIYVQNIQLESVFQELLKDTLYHHCDNPNTADYITALLILQMRLVLYSHLQQDDICFNLDEYWNSDDESSLTSSVETQVRQCMMNMKSTSLESSSATYFATYTTSHFVNLISLALKTPFEKCKSMAFNLLYALLDVDPQHVMKSTNRNENDTYIAHLQYSKVKDLSEEAVRQLSPRELAEYRKRCFRRSKLRQERSRRYAIEFCSEPSTETSGLNVLLVSAATTKDDYWRRECIVTMGRIVNVLHDPFGSNHPKGQTTDEHEPRLDNVTDSIIREVFVNPNQSCTIQEITETQMKHESLIEEEDTSLSLSAVKRCLFSTSLLLANGDIGAWTITHVWSNAMAEWEMLANSGNHYLMSVATEFASAAAGVEGTRTWISSCVDASSKDGVWRTLLTSSDKEVRSGAASTMAKLGLADKAVSSDEGELFALLEVAAGLLSENDKESDIDTDATEKHKTQPVHSKYQASRERGIELISYLAPKTTIKDEISHGFVFHGSSVSETSVLDKLVRLTNPKENISSTIKYSIACIFASLAVSIETLKKEAFEGKEITTEQYEQMQAMSKTKEELELEESKMDKDDPEALKARIKSMAKHNVPLGLVNMIDDASEHSLEQISIAMMRMANEPSVRGTMIQQGCLSACIKLNKRPSDASSQVPSSSSSFKNHSTASTVAFNQEERKIMRNAQHTIAKLLVTTNPNSLNTSQCMGSIQPLLQLVKDSESSDLQTFEALLSLTNLASLNESTKQRIVSEKGISILSYAMFSDHAMVRRAATECMSNLVPHPSMIEYLSNPDNLKVWVAFGTDYEDGNMECSRAALGCLAMTTQNVDIALAFVQLNNAKTCVKTILECGNLDLMHRILVLILNLVEHGRENKTCHEFLSASGTIVFCEAYVSQYAGGRDGDLKMKECNLSSSELQLMNVTLDLAKEIVKSF
jgi:hypothetical protein